ncbi:Bcr/CflA family multidrug efflux MFS transporter [Azonexus sp.]|uniref:Bcr/CflA family multidrug efflux MFS transporter n=1 Tax=Azonexus sp. TaxID=1872668 RepID=UPI0027B9D871|nr:Bcr/CflA family multidrug efflux MFS transporter [Azonexus sp.]
MHQAHRPDRLVILLGMLVAFGPLAIDLYLPALPAIALGLAAPAAQVQLSITVFLAGFALGMLCYGPISDRYGRRPLLLAGIALFVCASLACLLAAGIEQLIVARFFQALGGGAASVLARTVVRDVFRPAEALRTLSLMAMVTAIAPLVAPLIGGVLLASFGWRGTFASLFCWGLISLAVVWKLLPESLSAENRGQLPLGAAFAAYFRLLADPVALGLLLAGGMSFAGMFAYITASPFYFIELGGLSPLTYSWIFAANALGIFAANYLNSRLVHSRGAAAMAGIGCALAFLGALILPLAIRLPEAMALTIAAMFVIVSMTGLLGANCVGLLMARYPNNAGAAAALFGAAQFGFGMLASASVSIYHDGSGQPMAWTILITSTVSFAGYLLFRSAGRQA